MSDNDCNDESLAKTRGRRDRSDKSNRNAALERLRNLRGSKNKYEVGELKAVYDVVDEATYSKKVNDRLKDDWIVDDGNGLYTENGHELFDDDLIDDEDYGGGDSKKNRRSSKNKEKVSKAERESQKAGIQSVRDMWNNMSSKRKRDETKVSTSTADDDLNDLMMELHEEKRPKLNSNENNFIEIKQDNFLSGKIREEKSHKKIFPVLEKKKFVPFKMPLQPQIKDEPYEIVDYDDFNDNSELFESKIEPVESIPPSTKGNKINSTHISVEEVESPSTAVIENKRDPPIETKYTYDPSESFENMGQINAVKGLPNDAIEATYNVAGESGDKLQFYWLDMFEEPKNPGVLYIFGKIYSGSDSKFKSCCVVVKNVDRCIYLLPRPTLENGDPVSLMDVYNEFNDIVAPKFRITTFKSRKVERKYCFDLKDVPCFSEYVEIRYSGKLPALPSDFSGKTFSRVFGASSPLMENFLLEKKFKGPSWLEVSNAVKVESGQQHSWCKLEFTCEVGDINLDHTNNASIPPLVLVALTVLSVNDPQTKRDNIVFVGAAMHSNFHIQTQLTEGQYFNEHFSLFNKPPGEVWPLDVDKRVVNKFTFKSDSERGLLGQLLAKLQQFDADVFVGHDLNFELLIMQLISHKVANWSRIGRLKRTSNAGKGNKALDYRTVMAGRLMCDVKISAKELIRARSYELPTLASQILHLEEDRVAVLSGPEIKQQFGNSQGLNALRQLGMTQAITCIRLIDRLQVLPLALQITAIAGNILSRTLLGGRSERNEYLLLHAFYTKGYIVPDKFKPFNRNIKQEGEAVGVDQKRDKKSGGPSYIGGLVLNPKKGFYDNFVVLMDFNSLYPSIIQEYNICFTTSANLNDDGKNEPSGILPEEIRKLVESRRQVKNMMKDQSVAEDLMRQYDIRQKALKLTANSMYGCLGFRLSRFYAKELAALVTGKGREILLKTKDVVEKMGFEVIYGDTDSLMINSNTQDIQKVYQIGNKIKSEVNRMYKLLELEIDGVFRFLLLLKKKKYAALLHIQKADGVVEHVMELKGLDIVRRDWAPVAATTAKLILDEIMTEQQLDDKIFKVAKILADVAENLRAGSIPIKDLLITKQLAKQPEEYKDAQGLYHVQVARRMNASGTLAKKFRGGDTVSYLFCTDNLAHHPRELSEPRQSNGDVKKEETTQQLQPDPSYYLTQQVHPVVSRICEPIPGLDAAQIAEYLGLDPTAFKKRRYTEDEQQENIGLGKETEADKYKSCERFSFKCQNPECGLIREVESPFVGSDNEINFVLASCPGVGCSTSPSQYINYISNRLNLFIKRIVGKYYKNYYYCEDPSCSNRERFVPVSLPRGYPYPLCSICKTALMVKEYTDADLYKQISYLQYIFDVSKHEDLANDTEKSVIKGLRGSSNGSCDSAYSHLHNVVSKALQRSAYSEIKLGNIFQPILNFFIKREKQ